MSCTDPTHLRTEYSRPFRRVSLLAATAGVLALGLAFTAAPAAAQADASAYTRSRDMQNKTDGDTHTTEGQYNLGVAKLQAARKLGTELGAEGLSDKKRIKLQKRFDSAVKQSIQALETAVRSKDDWADAHAVMGLAHFEWAALRYNRGEGESTEVRQRFAAAQQCFAKALEVAPKNQFAVWGKAQVAKLRLPQMDSSEGPS